MAATTTPPDGPGGGTSQRLGPYLEVFRTALAERMTYRLDFALATALRFLPVLTTILLWQAVYAGQEGKVKGYTIGEMTAYLLLVQVSRLFAGMHGLADGIARDVRSGDLKKFLLQPIELLPYQFACRVAYALADLIRSAPPYAVLFALCLRDFHAPQSVWTWAAYAAALVLSFAVGFSLEAMLGMSAFWFLEVTAFLYAVGTVAYFLSGHLFPLDLLPAPWADVLRFLPFNYLGYFPAAVLTGRVTGPDVVAGLLGAAVWAVVFAIAARGLYRAGVRRYTAFGG